MVTCPGAMATADRIEFPKNRVRGVDLRLGRDAGGFDAGAFRGLVRGAGVLRGGGGVPGGRVLRDGRTADPGHRARAQRRVWPAARSGGGGHGEAGVLPSQHLDRIELIDEVVEFARALRGKVPMAMATGGTRMVVEKTLQAAGI